MSKKITVLVTLTLITLLSAALLGCIEVQPPEKPETLKLATTSLCDTGLLGHLEPIFEASQNKRR